MLTDSSLKDIYDTYDSAALHFVTRAKLLGYSLLVAGINNEKSNRFYWPEPKTAIFNYPNAITLNTCDDPQP